MLAGSLDFTKENSVYVGIDWPTVSLQMLDDADAPIDLTGWIVFAWCKKLPGTILIFDFNPQIVDAPNGIVTLALDKTQTKPLPAGSYTWDLIFENPSGVRLGPILAGAVSIVRLDTEPPL